MVPPLSPTLPDAEQRRALLQAIERRGLRLDGERAVTRTGGFVASAIHVAFGHRVCVKSAPTGWEPDVLSALCHPNVLGLLDRGPLAGGAAWWLTTWADRGCLDQWRSGFGLLTWAALRTVILDALRGLAHAHHRGVLHMDISPSNLLVCGTGGPRVRVMLGDFGGALWRGEGALDGRGTPETMAPEQLLQQRSRVGPWTDLYALGCVIFYLLNDRFPYTGSAEEIREGHLRGVRPRCPPWSVEAPAGLGGWLDGMLATRPDERFRTAGEALRALCELEMGHGVEPPLRRSPALHGRILLDPVAVLPERLERRLGVLTDSAADVRQPVLISISGPSGAGRSALARCIVDRWSLGGLGPVLAADQTATTLLRRLTGAPLRHMAALRRLDQEEYAPPSLPAGAGVPLATWAASCGAVDRPLPASLALTLARQLIRRGPLLVVIDDGPGRAIGLEVLGRILMEPDAPVLAVVVRAEGSTSLLDREAIQGWGRAGVHAVELEAPHGAALRERVTAWIALDDATVQRLEAACAGDLNVARLLLQGWLDAGALQPGASGLVLDEEAARDLPASVAAWWSGRLREATGADAASAVHLLALAAAEGLVGALDELQQLAPDAPERLWAALGRARLLLQNDTQWRLGHPTMRDWALGEVGEAARAALHARWAASLPARSFRRLHHLISAGRVDVALVEAPGAVQSALQRSDYATAEALVGRLLEAIPSHEVATRRVEDLLALRLRALFGLGMDRQVHLEAQRCYELARSEGWAGLCGVALRMRAKVALRGRDQAMAEAFSAFALDAARRQQDRTSVARAWLQLAEVKRRYGSFEEARQAGNAGLAELSVLPPGDPEHLHGEADALAVLADADMDEGRFSAAEPRYRAAMVRFEQVGNRFGVARAQNALGDILRYQERVAQARAQYVSALETYAALGSPQQTTVTLNLGLLSLAEGGVAAAQARFAASLHALGHDDLLRPYAIAGLLACYAHAGAAERASPLMQQLSDTWHRVPQDEDIARSLERAGLWWMEGEHVILGRWCLNKAAAVWASLGADDGARRCAALAGTPPTEQEKACRTITPER
ncbi:MAG: hypothetical protein H6739_18020 [Alphaproteobacteria bacterium]|nr:hypothetical protein [Alphaproteobacteria bacterium]